MTRAVQARQDVPLPENSVIRIIGQPLFGAGPVQPLRPASFAPSSGPRLPNLTLGPQVTFNITDWAHLDLSVAPSTDTTSCSNTTNRSLATSFHR
jgi:hypothetical protein